ncbi:MAG: type II secretion system protein GspL [Methylococcaceae bacterium]|jgi:general secretion pathway protein L
MNERYLARWRPDDSVEWLLLDTADAHIQRGSLQDMAEAVLDKPVTLLMSAVDILLLVLELPVKSPSQIAKALPFALEDLLADEVENYHLVSYKQQDKVFVAATSKFTFESYLAPFKAAGLNISHVYPLALCLPSQAQYVTVLVDGDEVVWRYDTWLGGGIEQTMLPNVAEKLVHSQSGLLGLNILQLDVGHTLTDISGLPVNQMDHIAEVLPVLANGVAQLGQRFNLLVGPYRPANTGPWQWRLAIPVVAVVVLAMVLQTGTLYYGYWQQKARLATIETQTEALFKDTFPDIKRIVNIKVQAEQQLAELGKQQTRLGSQFMRLLYQTGSTLSAQPGFQLKQLEFVNDSLQLQLSAPDISQLEQFKQQLESNKALQVKIQSAEAGQNSVEVHLEIKQK